MVHSHCVNAQAGLWFGIWDLKLGVTFQNHDIHFVCGIGQLSNSTFPVSTEGCSCLL